ncbi:MAG: efflux RND transporter permease subunit [Cyclobacteriaceae bacterium]
MTIASVCIERPVFAMVMSILIIIFGTVGFSYLGVREYPSVDPPVVSVSTNYTGANADVIESQITEPLEEVINGIAGIKRLTSISSDGRSSIKVEFELGVDMEAAANDVRDKVSRAVRSLPPDTDPPVISKSDADAQTIIALTVQSDQRDLLQLSEIGNNVFKERLQTIPGISQIRIWGDKKYSMRLQIDPAKLAAYGLTPLDVRDALSRENIELPTGRIEGYNTELSIRTLGRLTTEEEFNEMIIKEENGAIVKMKDIGQAVLAPENERSILRGNGGIPQIGVAVTPQPGTNYIAIADEFYKRVEQIKQDLPDDISIGVALDYTTSVRNGIEEVEETIFIAFGLVVIVIFSFLRSWRTTIIPVLAIPISLIGTFFIMYLMDFSINILSLLGIVLATGLVVDDAIVVLENIYAKIEKGMNPIEAGHKGSKEIIFAIISTTITLAAVFLPIIFLEGLTGRLFREFGIVVAGAVLISAFVSLTLTPMMSAKILRKKQSESKWFTSSERFFENLTEKYALSLAFFMKRRRFAFVIMGLSIFLIFWIGSLIPSELAPREDKSRFRVSITAPEGTAYDLMDRYMQEVVAVTDTIPEREAIIAVTSPGFGSSSSVNSGFLRVRLVPSGERSRTQDEIATEYAGVLRQFNFARAFVVQEPTIGGGRFGGLPVQFVIQAPDFEELRSILPDFMDAAESSEQFSDTDLNLKFNKPELVIDIDRNRARALGVSIRDVAETLQLFYSGQRFGYFIRDGKQYQVIGQAERTNRDEPIDLSSVFVRNKSGELIQLDNLVNLSNRSSPPQLYRFNRYVSATVSADLAEGYTLGQGITQMKKIASEVLDERFATSLDGTSEEFEESANSLLFAFIFALVLIYLVLSAQFESFIDPMVIMFTVPLALAGAVLVLFAFDQTFNIFSQIGIIVLIGIVTKNGILIVEFANQRKEQGLSKIDAALDAAAQRLRPILMTSLATALGALPIALALGAASQSRSPMGIAIIGGLMFSLILTLYVIPALYTFMSRDYKKQKSSDKQELQPA